VIKWTVSTSYMLQETAHPSLLCGANLLLLLLLLLPLLLLPLLLPPPLPLLLLLRIRAHCC
jgi:hypothetical protein